MPANSSYGDSRGDSALREAIALDLVGSGFAATPDQIVVTNGAMQALDVCFSTVLRRGEAVLMPQPGYFIAEMVRRAGGLVQGFASPEGHQFRPDWEAAERAITSETRVLFVNSPVNPTGYIFSEDDVEQAFALAERHGLLIVSDETYSKFIFGGQQHHSVLEIDSSVERTILIRSFSKDYAMPGWRLGYAFCPSSLAAKVAATVEWSCLGVNRAAQAAGHAAMVGPQGWVSEMVAAAERTAAQVSHQINSTPGLRCVAPRGGLNAFVGYDNDINALINEVVMSKGVPIHPGELFGTSGYFRFQFGGAAAAVDIGLARLASSVADLRLRSVGL
jgi:aspartate/methionine/tyrosine aminotransferase